MQRGKHYTIYSQCFITVKFYVVRNASNIKIILKINNNNKIIRIKLENGH